jgi:transcriptional regulator with XRE-family HTH domain/quercetin dioxygenase-like cupin family protein
VSEATVPPLGSRIRTERTRRGLTVRGLARDIGVSPSLISQIETDKSQPSVSTLYAITNALDIAIESLFDESDVAGLSVAASDRDVSTGSTTRSAKARYRPRPSEQRPRGRRNPVVSRAERESLTLDSGVTWERLGQVPNTHVEFLQITYLPGGRSSSSGELMRHSGVEYGYLLKGSLVLTLGFDEYRLSAGDAVSFDSTTPHGYRNDGVKPAVGVWFVIERG